MPAWIPIAYTAFLAVLVPVYWRWHGPGNFLWFSDLALFTVGAALWLESPFLASLAAVSVLPLEAAWLVDFVVRLATRRRFIGLAEYMFDATRPRALRALSLFHVPLPVLIVWLAARLGYDDRALWAATLLTWAVIPATFLLTRPERNVNWVRGPGRAQTWMAPWAWVALLLLALPIAVHLPTHLLLRALLPPASGSA
jgi:hypothetical protein